MTSALAISREISTPAPGPERLNVGARINYYPKGRKRLKESWDKKKRTPKVGANDWAIDRLWGMLGRMTNGGAVARCLMDVVCGDEVFGSEAEDAIVTISVYEEIFMELHKTGQQAENAILTLQFVQSLNASKDGKGQGT